jgi:hypothetical protein
MPTAKRSPQHYHILAEPWSVWVHGEKNSDWTNTLYDLVHSTEVKEYCSKDHGYSPTGSYSNCYEKNLNAPDWYSYQNMVVLCVERANLRRGGSCQKTVHARGAVNMKMHLMFGFNSMHIDQCIQQTILEHLRSWRNDAVLPSANNFLI